MNNTSTPVLEMRHVGKSFANHVVLNDINLRVDHGEIVTLIGPSGSGKTTALRCMNFLEAYDKGDVLIKGQLLGYSGTQRGPAHVDSASLIAEVRKPLSMVFQQFNLWPHMTVQENVAAPLVLGKKMSRQAAKAAAMAALGRVGMAQKADDWPARLSGGQQQRTGIARALALNPELLLLDEPTSALDPEMINEVLDVMVELANEGMTMMVVTHEMGFARKVANRVIFMDEGKIVEDADKEAFFANPQSDRAKDFLAKILH